VEEADAFFVYGRDCLSSLYRGGRLLLSSLSMLPQLLLALFFNFWKMILRVDPLGHPTTIPPPGLEPGTLGRGPSILTI